MMRKFKCRPFGEEVDLDDPKTYSYLPDDIEELNNRMLKDIGYSLCYMDFWHPDVFPKEKQPERLERKGDIWPSVKEEHREELIDIANISYVQRLRIYALIEEFTKNRRDNWKNMMWFKEQVFLFEDEIENMC